MTTNSWENATYEPCKYKGKCGIAVTGSESVIDDIDVALTDVSTILGHEFTMDGTSPDDEVLIKQAVNHASEKWAPHPTIETMKRACPKDEASGKFLTHAIATGTTTEGIMQEMMHYAVNSTPTKVQAPNKQA